MCKVVCTNVYVYSSCALFGTVSNDYDFSSINAYRNQGLMFVMHCIMLLAVNTDTVFL